MGDRTNLRTFELADERALLVYQITAGFPQEELSGLLYQLRRPAVTVPSNSVEGCVRASQADYLRFLHMALGSLRELHYQLDLSRRLKLLSHRNVSLVESNIAEAEKVLNGLNCSMRNAS
jgi:four helix bundle protein